MKVIINDTQYQRLKNYKELNKGADHIIYYLDEDYVLKTFKIHEKDDINELKKIFKDHITFMQQYPNIFVDIKQLDPYLASVEKLNTDEVLKELFHITNTIRRDKDLFDEQLLVMAPLTIIGNIYYGTPYKKISEKKSEKYIRNLSVYALKHNDKIIKKWIDFINEIKHTLGNRYLDLHSGNFGIDKNGKIKLLDF
jgi:predicted unusual protein kinase regulating ubiquinone biosynthesis (AarF/ABC1/UbiB family)